MMTEVAAMTRQASVKPGAVAAKAGGAPAGAATILDGAFAALLGEAAGADLAGVAGAKGKGGTFAGLLAAEGKDGEAGKIALDPALASAEGLDGEAAAALDPALLGEGEGNSALNGDIDPATGKPRKAGRRNEAEAEVAVAPEAAQAQAALAADRPAQADRAKGKPQQAGIEAAKGVKAAEAAAGKPAADATPVTAKQAEGEGVKGEVLAAAKGQPAQTIGTPAGTASNAAAVAGAANGGQSAESGEGRSEGRGNQPRSSAMRAIAAAAAKGEAAPAPQGDPLRDIMQSLPPVVQSQLNVTGPAGANAAPIAASAGTQLASQVIDMGVSGQWIDRMANEIAALSEGTGHARFQLNPPNLGRIQVDLWQGDDAMNVRFLAETDEAARRLRDGQDSLANHARVASLSLGSVSVEKGQLDSGREQNNAQNQNQRPGAEAGQDGQQQASAQAQGQSAQGRNGDGANRGGLSATPGHEPQADAEPVAAPRASDPRVRFA